MYFEKHVTHRNEMIAFAEAVGAAFKSYAKEHPFVVALDGDDNSGKSLVALGVDKVFNPERYSNGITAEIRADNLRSGSVQFHNIREYASIAKVIIEGADAENKDASVLIYSNPVVTMPEGFNRAVHGLGTKVLDMHITVVKLSETGFERRIEVAIDDPALIEALSATGTIENASQTVPFVREDKTEDKLGRWASLRRQLASLLPG